MIFNFKPSTKILRPNRKAKKGGRGKKWSENTEKKIKIKSKIKKLKVCRGFFRPIHLKGRENEIFSLFGKGLCFLSFSALSQFFIQVHIIRSRPGGQQQLYRRGADPIRNVLVETSWTTTASVLAPLSFPAFHSSLMLIPSIKPSTLHFLYPPDCLNYNYF